MKLPSQREAKAIRKSEADEFWKRVYDKLMKH
jgi:hypothetical protein